MSTKDVLWESGYDETVEVNQRALIDKVLARYSGEFTVFRELLQNSDDAQSEAVEIRFETAQEEGSSGTGTVEEELKDLKAITVHRWTFRNNGILFRDEDWNRLKKIAEGNPDEEKIGAFGVGFYSLFSITDDPFVTSGGQWMAFYWKDKKDQLYARRGSLPEEKRTEWTSFEMPLREPATIPAPFDFIRFLCSSITFMTSLRKISVFLDDKCLAKLEKTVGASQTLGMPRGLNSRTAEGTMTVTGVRSTALHIRADVMKWVYSSGSERKRPLLDVAKVAKPSVQGFFSSIFSSFSSGNTTPATRGATPLPPLLPEKINLLDINSTNISLSVFSADVTVKLDKKLTAELLRSTKKNPPSKMQYDLIFTGQSDYEASIEEDRKHANSTGSIFQGLRADLEGLGTARIFIGHATAQTTGIGGHMAARFIPTVERESIDFMDRNIAVWNKELLNVGAILSRAAYEYEMADIKTIWEAKQTATSPPPVDLQESLTRRALHALKFFTFHQSTPSDEVSHILEEGFFIASGRFPIISSRGVRPSLDVRLPDSTFMGFVKELPMLPDVISGEAAHMVASLQTRDFIKPIVFDDILHELRSRPLKQDEMVACMKWWISAVNNAQASKQNAEGFTQSKKQLLSAAVLGLSGSHPGDEKFVPLSSIRTFVAPKTIFPTDGPLPDHILPLIISKEFTAGELRSAFPWAELTAEEWLAHLCTLTGKSGMESFDFSTSPEWAERVLSVLARAWPSLNPTTKGVIYRQLTNKTCIPTNVGMKIPSDAYFPTVNMFPDLPIVTLPSGNAIRSGMEKFLQAMGIRKHVELQVIFTRMIKTNQWTIADLIKYLVSVRSTLMNEEMQYLRATRAFSRENDRSADSEGRPVRYCANELYEPLDTFRKLKLPVLDWGQKVKWRTNSEEAKFLRAIGLQAFPTLETLIQLCTSEDLEIRSTALQYLVENMNSKYTNYNAEAFATIAYLPAVRGTLKILGTPREVFSGVHWEALGFAVLDTNYHKESAKLQVKEHPSSRQLMKLLEENPPKDDVEASKMFAIISTRITDFTPAQLAYLSRAAIVPVQKEKSNVRPNFYLLPPSQCYLRANTDAIHSKLFTFVDFGGAANSFLMACGARQEPSLDEIARILLENPRRFYELCEGPEQYLSELRNLAVNVRMISAGTILRMKRNPILLAMQRKAKSESKEKELDEEEFDIDYDLKKADEIVIVDDTASYQAFGDALYTAPQEDILEGFYLQLGSRKLSGLVKEEHHVSAEIANLKRANDIRDLVLERLPLFLYEHTHSKAKISLTWLSSPNNFKVRSFGTLSIRKTLSFGQLHLTQRADASAVAKRLGTNGVIELWIAGNTQVDLYEVALSMNKLMFDAPKTNDALLLMTILSTDLRSLKRRGYNVNRILKQHRHAKEAQLPPPPVPPRIEPPPNVKQVSTAPPPMMNLPPPLAPKPDVALPGPSMNDGQVPVALPQPGGTSVQNVWNSFRKRFELPPHPPTPDVAPLGSSMNDRQVPVALPQPGGTSVQNVRNQSHERFEPPSHPPKPNVAPLGSSMNDDQVPVALAQPEGTSVQSVWNQNRKRFENNVLARPSSDAPPPPPTYSSSPSPGTNSQPSATPQNLISSNIDMAIKACRPESQDLVRNREHMEQIKESLNESYCDVSGHNQHLELLGRIGNVKVYISQDVPTTDSKTFMQENREGLARFIHVLLPLSKIYGLPEACLHIFYDMDGGLIAFNRNGSLFMNFRYYGSWHDAQVRGGQLSSAYISWYFTLAHEIAHNLVQPHNSEHEFYFSAICEKHLGGLAVLL